MGQDHEHDHVMTGIADFGGIFEVGEFPWMLSYGQRDAHAGDNNVSPEAV